MNQERMVQLRQTLSSRLNSDELRTLCFDMGIDYETLAGSNKPALVRELLLYCERRGKLAELVERIVATWPDEAWTQPLNNDPSAPSSAPPQAAQYQVHGDYVAGDKVAGDKIMGDKRYGTIVAGDQFNLSGDFSGAILNIKSTLRDVTQRIGAAPHGDTAAKEQLTQLLTQLSAELQHAPAGAEDAAEVVAEMAKQAVERATHAKPNKSLVQISADGLQQAAQNLAAVLPTILPIATQIADALRRFVG